MTLQAPAAPAVEVMMHGEDVGPDLFWLPADGLRQALTEGLFHLPDTLFHGPVVFRVIGWAVEGDDPVVGKHAVDGRVVEGAAVVALQEERSSVLLEEFFQVRGDRLALGLDGHQGSEAVPGAEVLDRVDVKTLSLFVPTPFRAVDGPGQVGFLPGHVLADLPASDVALGAFLGGHFRDAAPGEDGLVPHLQGADATAAFSSVAQGLYFPADVLQG